MNLLGSLRKLGQESFDQDMESIDKIQKLLTLNQSLDKQEFIHLYSETIEAILKEDSINLVCHKILRLDEVLTQLENDEVDELPQLRIFHESFSRVFLQSVMENELDGESLGAVVLKTLRIALENELYMWRES